MTDLRLEREYPISAKKLFDLVTMPEHLSQWFGTEAVLIQKIEMDLTKTGPWMCHMVGRDSGDRFKLSGQVTHVDAPKSVGFTWAWHDEQDQRGDESHVVFTVSGTPTGARLEVKHLDLSNREAAERHLAGWASTLAGLERLAK